MDFANRLKELRLSKGLTQQELAKKLNITSAAVSAYESGVRTPTIEGFNLLSQYFGVSIDYLAGNTEYYSDPQATELIQEYFERPELKILFDATKNVTREDILQVASILEKMSK